MNCSSSSGGSSSDTQAQGVQAALNTVRSKVSAVVPDTSSVAASPLVSRVGMTTQWLDEDHVIGGDFGDSPRNFVRNHGDESVQGMLMYRLEQVLENLCIFSTVLPSTNGIPNVASATTIDLTPALKTQIATDCDADVSHMPDNHTIGYQVLDISSNSGSQYEREINFDLSGSGGTDWENWFYFTINSNVTRMSFIEDSNNASAVFFEYNASTGIFRFEFNEDAMAGSSFKAHYRGILNENTNLGRFIAQVVNGSDDVSTAVVSTVEGGNDEMHVGYTFLDNGGVGPDTFENGSDCINTNTFAIAANDQVSCASGAITGVQANSFTFNIDTVVTSANALAADETKTINFTSLTDVLTADSAIQ